MEHRIDERLVELFLDLVQIDGPSGAERAVADYVLRFSKTLGLSAREQPIEPDHTAGNVLITVGGRPDRALLAHMDTARSTTGIVPLRLADRIQTDGRTILGADNRAGMAILLRTLERIAAGELAAPDACIAFTVCEESTLLGSRTLSLPASVRAGFTFDSSRRPGHFICGSYGAMRFDLLVHGKASHSGLAPEQGLSAIRVACEAVTQIPHGRIDATSMLNIGTIGGGVAVNVVPDKVTLSGEVRALQPTRVEALVREVEQTFAAVAHKAGARLEFESVWGFSPFEVESSAPVYRMLIGALAELGHAATPVVAASGSDANSLNARGVPTINLGIGAQKPHSTDEFILLADLMAARDLAALLATRPLQREA